MAIRRQQGCTGTTISGSAGRGSGHCVRPARETSSHFVHRLLLYAVAEEFLATTVPFLRCGLAQGDALLAVSTETNLRLLAAALGGDAECVDFADSADWYRYPARALAAYGDYVDEHPGRRVRIVGEPVWHGRTEAQIGEWARFESMCNAVFAGSPVIFVCPYDARRLGPGVLANALRTHPEQAVDAVGIPNRNYTEPAELVAEHNQRDLPEPPASATVVGFGRHDLAELRHLVADHAARAGMATQRLAELVFLVNEVADNAIEHGGGWGTLRMWGAGQHLVCEIASPAVWSGGPFASYPFAANYALRGVGMWISWQVCDRVEFRTGHPGTTMRMHVAAPRFAGSRFPAR